MDRDVTLWLSNQRNTLPAELKEFYLQFEELYDKKLWHQLTLRLEAFAVIPSAAPYLLSLYEHFISSWEKKMNKISLVQYVSRAAKQIKDPRAALLFLSARVEKLKDNASARDAYVLATMEAAHYKQAAGDLDGCKASVDECEKLLDELPATDPVIHATFYRVSADYFKAKMVYPNYYHNALLYLSSVSLDDLTIQEKQERAYELAVSALLGEGLYNFGKLLMHPVLDSLRGTIYDWLRHLLFCFNSGDMEGFEKAIRSADFQKQPLLVNALPFLRQKLCLMTLVETAFKRPKEARARLSFYEISRETRIPLEEVEHLIMKALSLGLIKGKIDEVDGIVEVTWVQPRVLDKSQIQALSDRLGEWSKHVLAGTKELESESSVQALLVQ